MGTPGSSGSARVEYIDATRGVAMFFVCVAHFGQGYLLTVGATLAGRILLTIGMLASPTFMLVSGAMVGFLRTLRPERFGAFRAKLVDRGAFLMTVGHMLILVPHIPTDRSVAPWAWGFITDAIGLAAVVGPWIVPRLRPRARCLLAGVLYGGSWAVSLAWHPSAPWSAVTDLLFGPFQSPTVWGYVFPLVPWLSLYLVGTVLGEAMASWRASGGDRALALRVGGLGVVIVAGACAVWLGARHTGSVLLESSLPVAMTSPFQKLPPGPTYLALQGGLGMVLLAFLAMVQGRAWTRWLFAAAGMVGRASLFVFVLQYYIFFGVPAVLSLTYTPAWPALFAAAVGLIALAAWFWDRKASNTYLTVGLERHLRPRI